MLDDIDKIPEIDEHIIISNGRFAGIFEFWAKEQHYTKPITVVDDGTFSNETRLGAVCDLLFAMDKLKLNDDLLVVAADNILFFSNYISVTLETVFRYLIAGLLSELFNPPIKCTWCNIIINTPLLI